jgi:putative hydrolase of the HAD superfamily
MNKIEHIVFDLGGVLVDWDGVTPLIQLTDGRLSFEDARRFWFQSPWIAKFETNQCTDLEFAVGIIEELSLNLTPKEFIQEFLSWNNGMYPGCAKMLKQLRSRYALSCLTNNNPLYINDLAEHHGLNKMFDHLFISYQTGFLKPTKEAFENVLNKLNSSPDSILFFDDNVECVDSAKKLGLNTYQVFGVDEVINVLSELEL